MCVAAAEDDDDLEVDGDDLMVSTLQNLMPLASNRKRIFQLMRETFAARRRWMKDNIPAVQTILSCYPRFSDVPDLVSSSSDFSNCIYFT
jgi:hypothetical protein